MSGTLSVAVDAILAASPERVFEALTKPELYSKWMGPEGSTTEVAAMEPVPGGSLVFTVAFPGGMSVRIEGEYLTVDPPRSISHTWLVEGDPHPTTVTINLHPIDTRTHMVLVHEGFSDEQDRVQNDGGWRHQIERLDALLAHP